MRLGKPDRVQGHLRRADYRATAKGLCYTKMAVQLMLVQLMLVKERARLSATFA
jgi:hypothetical protein